LENRRILIVSAQKIDEDKVIYCSIWALTSYGTAKIWEPLQDNPKAKAKDRVVGSLPKLNMCLRSSLKRKAKGFVKSHNIFYKEGGSPCLLLVIMVVTKENLRVGVTCIEASPQELPHLWKRLDGQTSKGSDWFPI
jgi:hypothetical protein